MYSMTDRDISKQVSDNELHRIGLKHIIKYGDLKKYSSLLDILPCPGSYVIILIESHYNSGHWVCMVRPKFNAKLIYYFDSYGVPIDGELKYIDPAERERLGEDQKYLTQLVRNLPKGLKVQCNRVKYQINDPSVSTCGKHVIMFIYDVLKEGGTMEECEKHTRNAIKKNGFINADHLVCEFTKQLFNI